MKFDRLYSKLLREMDVASVYGDAASDGDMTNGWGSDDAGTLKLSMSLYGGGQKTENKKKKKKKNDPAKVDDIFVQRRPSIGRM